MWQSSEGPQEPFAYRGSLSRFRARTGPSFIKAQSRHSLSILFCLPLTKESAQDTLLMDCAASKRTLPGVGSQRQRGPPILNPYYLVHLMY